LRPRRSAIRSPHPSTDQATPPRQTQASKQAPAQRKLLARPAFFLALVIIVVVVIVAS